MWAARMYDLNDVRVVEVPNPVITDNELLVKVKSVGICGTDLRMIRNGYPSIAPNSPRTLGHEIGGVIVEVGENITQYQVGMRVGIAPNMGCGVCDHCVRGDQHLCDKYEALGVQMDGGFAEYVRIPEQAVRFGNVVELPDDVTFDEAAINEPLSCVYNGMVQCRIEAGDDVLIIGAGPIGIMYAQMAKMAGASRVFITNRSTERLKICNEIDPTLITLESEGIKEQIMALTNGKGVNVCVTANPSPETQQLAIELVSMHGKINFFGGLPKDQQHVPINTNTIHYKQLIVTGSTKANNYHFRKTLQLIASGALNVSKLISEKFTLDQMNEALHYAMSSKGVKTIITFD